MDCKFKNSPWVEKYRPNNVNDILSQDDIINCLNSAIINKNLPHLLFHGPPGVGKTTTALALCNHLFGPSYKERILELNASDDRGIDIVRKKIKTFASLSISQNNENDKLPPFKIIILDEVDNMTQDAQAALRRIMESYSKITRFILICNYITYVIEPINSRCVKFRFKYMESKLITNHLKNISEKENYNISDNTINEIIRVSNGDMRSSIMLLQTGITLYGSSLSPQQVLNIVGHVPNSIINQILLECKKKDFHGASKIVNKTILDGYTGYQILMQLSDSLMNKNFIKNNNFCKIAMTISKIDYRLTCGADQKIQLLEVIGTIIRNI